MKLYRKKLLQPVANITLFCVIILIANYSKAYPLDEAEELHNDQQKLLYAHNKIRVLHHAPKLVWDDELASYAERYANKCEFKHSKTPYGENLAAGYPSIYDAVNAWYAERAYYSYTKPGFSNETGHFTQLIWKSSKKIGCAYTLCNGKNGTPGYYLVCEYSPAGNIVNKDHFAKNVLPE
jgi:uncharacterized protein YkwD